MALLNLVENGISRRCTASDGENLLAVLRREGVSVAAPCGGRGNCGKCTVRVNGTEQRACRTCVSGEVTVEVPSLSGGSIAGAEPIPVPVQKTAGGKCRVAVDLGTTTIAVCCLTADGTEETLGEWNALSAYGTDVLSRISYCEEHPQGLEECSSVLRAQVLRMVRELCGAPPPEKILLAGNTVMQHLFAGLSPSSIARAPFRPECDFTLPLEDRLGGADVRYAPCVSGYIGGDIVSGLLASGAAREKELCLFLDVGTNGEMALGSAGGFLCCSVACGPAFEGAGIACGMPGLPGAIDRVDFNGEAFSFSTVAGAPPRGICGSGLLSLLAALRKAGILTEDGWLRPPEETGNDFNGCLVRGTDGSGVFCLSENVFLTVQDVRSLQLAKGAVAAGIAILLEKSGRSCREIRKVYLAGGFGSHLNPADAGDVGMLPAMLQPCVEPVGNASLNGAKLALQKEAAFRGLHQIRQHCRALELAGSARFQQLFLENLALKEQHLP